MKYRHFKPCGSEISLLGMGGMRFPTLQNGKIDEKRSQEIIDYAYENGINYFDTAYMYHDGKSEEFIGRALKKYPRESYNLISKMPGWFVKEQGDVEKIFNTQLKRCGVDYFDFYLLHSIMEDNFDSYYVKYNIFDFVNEMKKQGKVRHIGFSFHDTPEFLEKVIDMYSFEFAQIQLNYLDWDLQNAKKQYEIIKSRGIQCIVMEPVRGGALADLCPKANELLKSVCPDKSIASWAVRFAAEKENVLTVLSGMSSMEQIVDNVKTVSELKPFSEAETKALSEALELYRNKDRIPCTGCRYCMDCPSGVDIPAVFAAYNEYVSGGSKEDFLYAAKSLGSAGSQSCVECGACMRHCPQGIKIPENMRKIDKAVEKAAK